MPSPGVQTANYDASKADELDKKARDKAFDAFLAHYFPGSLTNDELDALDEDAEAALVKAAKRHLKAAKEYEDEGKWAKAAEEQEKAAADYLAKGYINDDNGEGTEARDAFQAAIDSYRKASVNWGGANDPGGERAAARKARKVWEKFGNKYGNLHNP